MTSILAAHTEPASALGTLRNLPLEMRQMIYKELLCDHHNVTEPNPFVLFHLRIFGRARINMKERRIRSPALSITGILDTSKTLKADAEEILYARSTFLIDLR